VLFVERNDLKMKNLAINAEKKLKQKHFQNGHIPMSENLNGWVMYFPVEIGGG